MKIKQGKAEFPVRLGTKATDALADLLERAGQVAAGKAALAAEEAEVKRAFEAVRGSFEKQHDLRETYTVVGATGVIAVSTGGTAYELGAKFRDPLALRNKLEALGAPELLEHFVIEAVPVQRTIKDRMCKALLAIGALKDKPATIALKAAGASAE